MTLNFDNDYLSSPVMREFIRITASKNPQQAIQKTASASIPEPTSFSESILLLCSELRSNGFTSHASELEKQFLLLKQAKAHMYNTHDETGEDFIEFAHPGGGNKELDKGWGELGEVEDILERHKKMLDVVHKEPKGLEKQASVANIARIILAQDASVPSQVARLQQQVRMQETALKRDFDNVASLVKQRGGISWYKSGLYDKLVADIDELLGGRLDLDALDNLLRYINTAEDIVMNTMFNKQDVKDISPLFERIKRRVNGMIAMVKQANELEMGTLLPEAGEAGTEAGTPQGTDGAVPVSKRDLDASFAHGMQYANGFLAAITKYEAKAANDPKKLDIVHKTEGKLRTFISELQGLYAAVKAGESFEQAAAKTTLFKSLQTEEQLKGDIDGFFSAATKIIDYMKTW